MLTFCEKCENIMVLKKKNGRLGEYICRACGNSRMMQVEKLEIKEDVVLTPPEPIFVPFKKKIGIFT